MGNWNSVKIEIAWKWKYDLKEDFLNYIFNIFDNGYEIGECFLMASLMYVKKLKSKLKSNWNYMKIEVTCKWKRDMIFFSV